MSITWSHQSNLRVLITGGAGFIGGALVRRLLSQTSVTIFNLDKLGYASDLTGIDTYLNKNKIQKRYYFIKEDLCNRNNLDELISKIDPDIVFHLAAESHVDKSIEGPEIFLKSNILGTFNLLEALRNHWERLSNNRRNNFRFHHVSTDEVYGSLDGNNKFNEKSQYAPRSPYSASKASSDHIARAYFQTFNLPVIVSNCSNNYGAYQFPEKLIPLVINNALSNKDITIYGDGHQIRDWLHVSDHCRALRLIMSKGSIGETYNIGGNAEKRNIDVVNTICEILDELKPRKDLKSYKKQITFIKDRPGHDKRYAIDCSKLEKTLKWKQKESFTSGIKKTVDWYLKNIDWLESINRKI